MVSYRATSVGNAYALIGSPTRAAIIVPFLVFAQCCQQVTQTIVRCLFRANFPPRWLFHHLPVAYHLFRHGAQTMGEQVQHVGQKEHTQLPVRKPLPVWRRRGQNGINDLSHGHSQQPITDYRDSVHPLDFCDRLTYLQRYRLTTIPSPST